MHSGVHSTPECTPNALIVPLAYFDYSIPRFFESYTAVQCVNDTQENETDFQQQHNPNAEWFNGTNQAHPPITSELVHVSQNISNSENEVHCNAVKHVLLITDLRLDPYYISVS